MRAFTVILAMLAAYAAFPVCTPASAQERQTTRRSEAEQKEDNEVDKAYRNATRGSPAPVAKVDPWSTVRPADTDKKPKK